MRAPRRLALPQRGGTPGPQPARFGPSLSSRGAGRTPRGLRPGEQAAAAALHGQQDQRFAGTSWGAARHRDPNCRSGGAEASGRAGGHLREESSVSGDALWLMAELLTIFVVETAVRSVRQAQAEDLALVDVDQLEKVLPQLLLDF
ncbi:hypothetical protein PANDA_000692 [Ailuropoda melanoleuca]|uniref:Centromere protein X n=1 Tax=Ailuropoda melanoleuca TaxID=9646 RepID=D2GVE5_AILME|nr:hypothetical protein PANDA_000692 [Ailuropoda melanoleuca]